MPSNSSQNNRALLDSSHFYFCLGARRLAWLVKHRLCLPHLSRNQDTKEEQNSQHTPRSLTDTHTSTVIPAALTHAKITNQKHVDSHHIFITPPLYFHKTKQKKHKRSSDKTFSQLQMFGRFRLVFSEQRPPFSAEMC